MRNTSAKSASAKRDILFFDARVEGHHSEYAQHLVQYAAGHSEMRDLHFVFPSTLSEYGASVVKTIENEPHIHFHKLSSEEKERIDNAALLWRSFVEWIIVMRYVRHTQADHCVLLELNIFQLVLGFFRKLNQVEISGILFFPYPRIELDGQSVSGRLFGWLEKLRKHLQLRWMLRNQAIGTVFVLNDGPSAEHLNQFWPERRPFSMLPDPVPSLTEQSSSGQARQGEGEPKTGGQRADVLTEKGGRVNFLMFGALREAKGVRNVINAFGQLDAETAARARLCLLGEVQPDLKGVFPELISSLRHVQSRLDLQVEDRFLPDEELEAALQAADVVLAPYLRTEGSSGVVGLSARYRSPVIGPDSGLVGSLIEQYDLGLTVNASDPTAIATAIRRYIRQRPDGKATEGMQSYVHERTPERFAETIFSAVLNGKY